MDKGMATTGTVTSAVTALTCVLEVYTIDATPAALPGTGWFSQSIFTNIDGGPGDNTFSNY